MRTMKRSVTSLLNRACNEGARRARGEGLDASPWENFSANHEQVQLGSDTLTFPIQSLLQPLHHL